MAKKKTAAITSSTGEIWHNGKLVLSNPPAIAIQPEKAAIITEIAPPGITDAGKLFDLPAVPKITPLPRNARVLPAIITPASENLPTFRKGNVTIYNEDCMQLLARTPDKHYDLAIVDPPYGINHAKIAGEQAGKKFGQGVTGRGKYDIEDWDNAIPPPEYFIELRRVSKHQIIWGGNYFANLLPNSSCWLVWDKDNAEGTYYADCELAYTSFELAVRKFRFKWSGMLQENMKEKEVRIHPTQKPVQLYRWQFDKYVKPGMRVLDTHIGSGNIGIAAFYTPDVTLDGCEISPRIYQKAIKNIDNKTVAQKLF